MKNFSNLGSGIFGVFLGAETSAPFPIEFRSLFS